MANSPCNLPLQTQNSRPPHQTVQCTAAVVSSFRLLPPSTPSRVLVPTTPAYISFLRKKIPASHRTRDGTSIVSLALGANREGKKRIKGKASRVQSTRIGSALVCVRRNVQHRELKLSKSTRFALITVVMVAVPTGCVVSPLPLFSQNIQSHEKYPTSQRALGVPPTVSLALGANRKERVKDEASGIRSSQIGSALVCVHRNAQHRELKLPESTRFVLNTVLMVTVSTHGPTGASTLPLSSQNVQSHEKPFTHPRARGEAPTMSFVLGINPEDKERVKGKSSQIGGRIGSSLECVRRNAQHLELKLLESTWFVLNTVLMFAVSTCGPIGCPVSPPPLSSQNIQLHEKSPTSRRARGETQTISLAQDANPGGRERVKVKASRIQSIRRGSALVCVRRNVQNSPSLPDLCPLLL